MKIQGLNFVLQNFAKSLPAWVVCTRARLNIEVDYALLLIAMNCVPRDNLARLTRGSQPVINTGHYQPFKHPHVTRSPPIGVDKTVWVFMNNNYAQHSIEMHLLVF